MVGWGGTRLGRCVSQRRTDRGDGGTASSTVEWYWYARIEVDLISRCVYWSWGASLVVVPCHVVLCLCQCRFSLLQCFLHSVCELVDRFDLWRGLVRFETGSYHLHDVFTVVTVGCLVQLPEWMKTLFVSFRGLFHFCFIPTSFSFCFIYCFIPIVLFHSFKATSSFLYQSPAMGNDYVINQKNFRCFISHYFL